MSFNGSGTYTPPGPQYPAIAGTLIKAADFNAIISDIAAALSMCLVKDGQQTPTGNLPMGGLKHTGVGKAAARDQYATYEQLQDGEANFVAPANVAGTANAVTLSLSPAPTGYETAIDLFYVVEIENTSEDVTHNLNAIGLLNTKKFYGGVKVKVAIGDFQIGMMAHLKYDGTDLILMNPRGYAQATDVASAATIDLDACTGDLVDVTGTTDITAITLRRGQERTVRFTGALNVTPGASLILPDNAAIKTAAGDYAIFRGYAAGVVRCVGYMRLTNARQDVASAATVSLDAQSTNYTNITGTTTITAFTLAAGRQVRCRADGNLPITAGASLLVQGITSGQTGIILAGEFFDVMGEAAGVVRLAPLRPLNTPVILGSGGNITAPVDTVENTLATVTVPGKAMGRSGRVRIHAALSLTNNANNKTVRIRFGVAGAVPFSKVCTTDTEVYIDMYLDNTVAASSLVGSNGMSTTRAGVMAGQAAGYSLGKDTDVDQTVTITVAKATAGDSVVLLNYMVELLPGYS